MIQCFAPYFGGFYKNNEVFNQLGLPAEIVNLLRTDRVLKFFIVGRKLAFLRVKIRVGHKANVRIWVSGFGFEVSGFLWV
jgi:hypothetical protein